MAEQTTLPKLSHELLADAVQHYLHPKELPAVLPPGYTPESYVEAEYAKAREHMRLSLANYRVDHAIADGVSMASLIETATQAAIAGDLELVKKCLFPLRTVAAFTKPVDLDEMLKGQGDGG